MQLGERDTKAEARDSMYYVDIQLSYAQAYEDASERTRNLTEVALHQRTVCRTIDLGKWTRACSRLELSTYSS